MASHGQALEGEIREAAGLSPARIGPFEVDISARLFDYHLLDPGGSDQHPAARCLPVRPRTANRNPRIVGFEVDREAMIGEPFGAAPTLDLGPGQKVLLRPLLSPDAEEEFQAVESTLQSNQLVVVNRKEELIVSWFATSGRFQEPQTAAQLTRTLANTFTAPALDGAEHKNVSLYAVVRDQRGGVGWQRLDVQVRDPIRIAN